MQIHINRMDRFSLIHKKNFLQIILSFITIILFTAILFSLRFCSLDGADRWFFSDLIQSDQIIFFYRSLLTVILHQAVYQCTQPFGFDGATAIALSSSLAGAIALQTLLKFSRNPLFLAMNVLTGSFMVFVGHVENYAWVNTFLILSFYWIKQWMENNKALWPAMLFFVLACLSHMLAIFYIPAYLMILYRNRRFDPLEIVLPLLLFSLVMVAASLSGRLQGTDNGLERLVPWIKIWSKNHHFTLLSLAHIKMLAFFHQQAAYGGIIPLHLESIHLQKYWYSNTLYVGIPIELPLLFYLQKRINSDYLCFMTICALCGIGWTTIWHPDWGPLDWDLFSQFAIPLHLLLGLLAINETTRSTTDSGHPVP